MITAIVNTESRNQTMTLKITYPEFAKKKPVFIKVNSYQEAEILLRIRELKFISNEIRSFINMRRYAFEHTQTWTAERIRAINHLQFVVDTYSEGSTLRLAKHIANSSASFSVLMPYKESPAKSHFNNHIIPILQYCIKVYNQSLKN